MQRLQTLSILALPLLIGCATVQDNENRSPKDRVVEVPMTPEQGFGCQADTVQYAIGQIATAQLGGKLAKESGAELLRWIPPRTAVTMDYRAERLNISYDDDMRVTLISCG